VYYCQRGNILEINNLIDQILSGTHEKFESIVNRYEKPIFSFLTGMGISSTNVEDIAQDVFISAFQNLSSFDHSKSQFSTWLFTIAKNKAINYSRKKQLKSFFGFNNETLDQHCSTDLPFDQIQNTRLKGIIADSLHTLPNNFKTCAVLFFYSDLNLQEIAEIEKCSVGTVKSRLFRAKEAMKKNLKIERGFL
jgi:RNA polymerase sigma-70 factor (ECF subfamily)